MQDTCERIRQALAEQLKLAFGRDLDALLSSRGRELWIIGIDPKKREMGGRLRHDQSEAV
jgi:hypothetical protein